MSNETLLGDYLFYWKNNCYAACFGPISFSNHSETPNIKLVKNYDFNTISAFAIRPIMVGEQLTHKYHKVWFEIK